MLPLVLFLATTAQAAVIGIDLGSEYFKISLIQPGKKLEIVENVQSKRITPTLLAFTDEARLMGAEAQSRASTKPEFLVPYFLRLLGIPANSTDARKQMKDEFITLRVEEDPERHTFKVAVKEQMFATEELVAMIFELAKAMSETFSKGSIKDCAVTVPPYWTRAQRQLLIQTAEAAKLHVLSLVHENTAAALYYGVDRNDTETPHHAIFYNMGASKLQVSLVRYTAVQKKFGQYKTVENIEVLAHAWDSALGGNFMDALIANHLATVFETHAKIDPKSSPKSMSKLMKEANKAKRVLSANKNFHVFIDPFMGGKMINENVERGEFEEMLKPHESRFLAPVETVLQDANLTISDIDSFEVIGGVTRVPKLQEILKRYYGKELGMHLNGDEAMAHGTALFAANLTRDIQVKPIWLSDVFAYPVKVRIEGANPGSDLSKSADLFRKWAKLGSRKQISLTCSQSILATIIMEYPSGEMPIIRYNITGVEEFAKKYETDPVLYLMFTLDSSGLPVLLSAEAKVEVEEEAEKPAEDSADAADTDTNSTDSADEAEAESEQKKPEESTQVKKKVKKVELDLKPTSVEFPSPMSIGGVKLTAGRLLSLAREDTERRKTAESRNELESYIYFLREKLEEETFVKVTTEDERTKLEKLLGDVREWLDGPDFHTATSSVVEEKKEKLQSVAKDAEDRESEYQKREEAVADAYSQLTALNKTMKEINDTRPWVSQEDKDEAMKKLNETVAWLKGKIEEQAALKPWEAPAFKVSQIKNKIAGAAKAVDKVKRIQKPKDKTAGDSKSSSGKKKNKLPEFFNFGPGMDGSNIKMENVKIGDEVYNYDPNAPDEEERAPETDIREEL